MEDNKLYKREIVQNIQLRRMHAEEWRGAQQFSFVLLFILIVFSPLPSPKTNKIGAVFSNATYKHLHTTQKCRNLDQKDTLSVS